MTGFFAAGRWWDVSPVDHALIQRSIRDLADAGIADATNDVHRLWVAAARDEGDFRDLIARRAARTPLSHLLGYRDFFKHRFFVSPDVLDPRPDTEDLVIAALEVPFLTVLDLGTGSGCILLSLLADRAQARGVGTDLSQDALAVAQSNAENLNLTPRATLIQSDWYADVSGAFDLIVSNPPYISADEMAGLQPEVRDHEPRMALTDEGDGLACYRVIIAGAPDYLTADGWLMLEIGPTQAADVTALMVQQGFARVAVRQDIDGRDRVVCGQNPQK